MADKKISQFDNGGAIQTTDEIATNRGGVNTKVFVGSAAALNTGNDPGDIPTNADLATQFAEIGKVKARPSDNFPSELVNKIIQGSNVSINLEVDSSGNEYLIINASAGATNLPDGDYGDITVSGSGSVFTIKSDVVDTSNLGGDITAAGKALLDDANAAAQRTTLGLGSSAVLNYGLLTGDVPLYETGSWTPTLEGTTTAGTQTYGTVTGRYTRIGNMVILAGRVAITAKGGTMAGNVKVGGLPYPCGAGAYSATMAYTVGITVTSGQWVTGIFNSGNDHFLLFKGNGISNLAVTVADIANSTELRFNINYWIGS